MDTNTLITPAVAALFALALNEAAYMAEIVRGGILGRHSGQREAGAALGMPNGLVMFRIVLPQAMKSRHPADRERADHPAEDGRRS